jgi:hypothetical protein
MGAALVLALLLAAVTAFVWGFVLQEDTRAVRHGWARVAGLPGRLRQAEATSPFWQGVGRWSARVAHGAELAWMDLRAFGGWIARTVAVARERRRGAVEERERSARVNFERTFFQTAPLPSTAALQSSFAEPEPRSSRLVAAIELTLLIAISGGVVAGAIFGVSHVLAHVLAHLRPG